MEENSTPASDAARTEDGVKKAGKNKVWLIVIGALVILALGWFFTGGLAMLALKSQGVDVDIDRNLDGTMTYETEEGTVTAGPGASMPANWPSDAPQPFSGATIMYSGTNNPTNGAAGSAVVYTAPGTIPAVLEYYTGALTSGGWTIEGTANMQGMNVLTASKDTRTIGIYVADAGDGQVQVTAGVEL